MDSPSKCATYAPPPLRAGGPNLTCVQLMNSLPDAYAEKMNPALRNLFMIKNVSISAKAASPHWLMTSIIGYENEDSENDQRRKGRERTPNHLP